MVLPNGSFKNYSYVTMLLVDAYNCLGGGTLLSLGFKVAKNWGQLATLETMWKVKFRHILMVY